VNPKSIALISATNLFNSAEGPVVFDDVFVLVFGFEDVLFETGLGL